jgi:hypothetical protein
MGFFAFMACVVFFGMLGGVMRMEMVSILAINAKILVSNNRRIAMIVFLTTYSNLE